MTQRQNERGPWHDANDWLDAHPTPMVDSALASLGTSLVLCAAFALAPLVLVVACFVPRLFDDDGAP